MYYEYDQMIEIHKFTSHYMYVVLRVFGQLCFMTHIETAEP